MLERLPEAARLHLDDHMLLEVQLGDWSARDDSPLGNSRIQGSAYRIASPAD